MPYPSTTIILFALIALVAALAAGAVAVRLGFPLPDERRRAGSIDGLRGYLALLVMVHHFGVWTVYGKQGQWRDPPSIVLSNFGVISVFLFFMITGYLFYPRVASGLGKFDWRRLYVSRFFRILPLQAVVVITVSVIALIRVNFHIGNTWIDYPARAALWMTSWGQPKFFGYEESGIVNASVLWSLKVEWTFYLLILPVLALICSTRVVQARRFLVPVVMAVIGVAVHRLHPKPIFLDNLVVFACGIAAHPILAMRGARWFAHPLAGLLAAAGFVGVMLLSTDPLNPIVLVVVGFFFLCIAAGNRFGGIVSNKAAIVLGEISFGIYMFHGIVLNLFFHTLLANWPSLSYAQAALTLPLLAIAVVAVAAALHLVVERPFIELGRKLVMGRKPRPDEETAGSSVVVAP